MQYSHSSQSIKVNREEILHCIAHEWERIVASVNKNDLICPSNDKIIPLMLCDNIRCWYNDNIGFLIPSNY